MCTKGGYVESMIFHEIKVSVVIGRKNVLRRRLKRRRIVTILRMQGQLKEAEYVSFRGGLLSLVIRFSFMAK